MIIKILGILAVIVIASSLVFANGEAEEIGPETDEHVGTANEAENSSSATETVHLETTAEEAHDEAAEAEHGEEVKEGHAEEAEEGHVEEAKPDPMLVAYGVVATILSLAGIYFVLGKIMR